MRFGLLGNDPRSLPLVRAAVELGHPLVWVGECNDLLAELRRLAPSTDDTTPWESLLSSAKADIVIVGRAGDSAARRSQLRSLVQSGISLLVVQPLERSAEIYYELEMDRRETKAILHHYTPGAGHPALIEFRRMLEMPRAAHESTAPLVFERTVSDLQPETVFDQFVCDAEILEGLCGIPDQVVAMAGSPSASGSHVSLQMAFRNGVMASWSTRLSGRALQSMPPEAVITVGRSEGRVTLRAGPSEEDWVIDEWADGQSRSRSLGARSDARGCVEEMVRNVSQGECRWANAIHFVELGEAARMSLRRGRGVKLTGEGPSEAAAFKATMASAGCLILVASVVLAVLLGFLEALGLPVGRVWWSVVAGTLALYLAMQVLLRLASSKADAQPGPGESL
jgi:hypothetical protein